MTVREQTWSGAQFGSGGRAPGRSAFSLLELVLAISLLAAISVTCWTWVAGQGRISQVVAQRMAMLETVHATTGLLRDDLAAATMAAGGGRCRVEDGALICLTLHRTSGDRPGYRLVTWRFDAATGRVLRAVGAADGKPRQVEREVTHRLTRVSFDAAGGAVRMTFAMTGSPDEPMTIAVWDEPVGVDGNVH